MDSINKLTEYFTKFPGVGPRQARRMVYYILRQNRGWSEDVAKMIVELKRDVTTCTSCFRHYIPTGPANRALCNVCADETRAIDTLMIVEKDVDFENIEKSGIYRGRYFILGGMYAPLAKNPEAYIRSDQLIDLIAQRIKEKTLRELIIALAVNPEGEETRNFLLKKIHPLLEGSTVNISTLGRGLSTGSELEYADSDTIKSAFETRT